MIFDLKGRRSALVLTALFGCAVSAASAATSAPHSAVRLLDGAAGPNGGTLAGIEIRLDPGFITYWRSPGEAGVPPVFDFSASTNVTSVKIDYPAPRLIDEDGTQAYGYDRTIIFPVRVVPKDRGVPVKLDLVLDYALCSKLCLPAKAHVTLALGHAQPDDVAAIRAASAAVPESAGLGGTNPIRIDTVAWSGPTSIVVDAVVPNGEGTLFVEAPEPWYFSATPVRPAASGHIGFTLRGPDHPPAGPVSAEPLRLTLVAPSGSIEVPVRLDAVRAKP